LHLLQVLLAYTNQFCSTKKNSSNTDAISFNTKEPPTAYVPPGSFDTPTCTKAQILSQHFSGVPDILMLIINIEDRR